jgi:MHS family proline/betaine transporter-like MFS transporter
MESDSYLNKPASGHTRKSIEVEIPDVYSGVIDFESSHLIGKKGKAIIAALLGTIVEWYDYSLYGCMAGVLAAHFFPSQDPSVSLLKHFLVFSLGFLVKPLGAYIFGTIGDNLGRKKALRWSIVGIALPTVIIGCLPSYNEIGVSAVVILCLCRLTQGLFISAEADGVNIFIYETLSKKRACLANSSTWISSSLGFGLAAFLSGIVLSPKLPEWAWRLPFLLAGVLGLITLWLRKSLIESYDYMLYRKSTDDASVKTRSFWQAIKFHKFKILFALMLKGAGGGACYFYCVFWYNYFRSMF